MATKPKAAKPAPTSAKDPNGKAPTSTRSLWKGAISFGLVHVPIALYSATDESGLSFKMLDKQAAGIKGAEMAMARQLIDEMSSTWSADQFRDSFQAEVMKLEEGAAAGARHEASWQRFGAALALHLSSRCPPLSILNEALFSGRTLQQFSRV